MRDLGGPRLRAGHDLEARVEVDHGRGELLQGSLRRLPPSRFRPRSGLRASSSPIIVLLEVRPIDRERQVGVIGLEARDIGERGVLNSTMNFSPLSGVTRLIVKRMPSAFAAVHANSEEVEEELGRHRPDHVGAARIGRLALRNAGPELVGSGEEAVAEPRVLLLVADLLEDVGEQILGVWFSGSACTSLFTISVASRYLPASCSSRPRAMILSLTAHHLNVERRGTRSATAELGSSDCSPRTRDSAG